MERNEIPTRKLENQFVTPETLIAAGNGPWENNSATMNHGIGPEKINQILQTAKEKI